MSHQATTAVYQHSRSKGSARLVLLAMADEANDEGLLTAYRRSQSHLARKANLEASSVKRAIQTLAELGEIEVLQRGNGRASTDYRLLLPGLIEGGHPATPGGTPRPPRGGNLLPQGGHPAPPIIPLLPGTTPSPQKPRGDKPPASPEADRLARAEWDRRTTKPVCGFVALRARIEEVLEAGYQPQQVAAVLPRMPVFSRNAFDFALRSAGMVRGSPPGPSRLAPSDDALLRLETDYDPEAF